MGRLERLTYFTCPRWHLNCYNIFLGCWPSNHVWKLLLLSHVDYLQLFPSYSLGLMRLSLNYFIVRILNGFETSRRDNSQRSIMHFRLVVFGKLWALSLIKVDRSKKVFSWNNIFSLFRSYSHHQYTEKCKKVQRSVQIFRGEIFAIVQSVASMITPLAIGFSLPRSCQITSWLLHCF